MLVSHRSCRSTLVLHEIEYVTTLKDNPQRQQGQWNNHNSQRQPLFPSPQPPPKQPNHLEEALTKLTLNTNTFIEETRSNFKNQGEALKKVEVQMGDLAKQFQ
ncbi:hypothetical protein PIB30_098230 [Stylosanthes scabra]|uniref:Uncharacterized protein n=1 Tax=Stylosanthes scabra TaxID=79078 RepID=A0ABU6WUP7_9FABA|nr:hypothetical protein [Stylosanthes scabra]